MSRVLYFHGFASSPKSAKITALRPLLSPDIELITPDLNVPSFEKMDVEAMIGHALEVAKKTRPRAIVGSSLGALLALELTDRGVDAPLLLIAPALGVAQRWQKRIPPGDPVVVFNHALGHDAPIHRAFFDQIARLRSDEKPPATRVVVIMGRKDETVPFSLVHDVWTDWEASGKLVRGSRFVEVSDGDHGLTASADLIANEIRQAVR